MLLKVAVYGEMCKVWTKSLHNCLSYAKKQGQVVMIPVHTTPTHHSPLQDLDKHDRRQNSNYMRTLRCVGAYKWHRWHSYRTKYYYNRMWFSCIKVHKYVQVWRLQNGMLIVKTATTSGTSCFDDTSRESSAYH